MSGIVDYDLSGYQLGGYNLLESSNADTSPRPARLAVSSDQQTYDVGDLALLTATFTSLTNSATPAVPSTVSVTVEVFTKDSHGAEVALNHLLTGSPGQGHIATNATTYTLTSDPAIANPSDGVYTLYLPIVDRASQYRYKWQGTGAATVAEQGRFTVRPDFA